MNNITREVSARISILRFMLIAGIVMHHVPTDSSLIGAPDTEIFPYIKAFLSHALFKMTVPVLTCISGFLLFSAGLDQDFPKLLAKKTKTLLLPFLLANVPVALAIYFGQANGLFANFRTQLYPFEPATMLNGLLSFTDSPANFPLYFLRDLYLLSLTAPLLGWIIRKAPGLGLFALCAVVALELDGPLLIRDTMLVNFYIGGLAAVQRWDLTKFDRFAPACAVVLLAACAAIVAFWIDDTRAFVIVVPFLLWPISSRLPGTLVGDLCQKLAPHSYFLFLTHAPLIMVLWDAYLDFRPMPYVVFWVVAPTLIITVCVTTHKIARTLRPMRIAA